VSLSTEGFLRLEGLTRVFDGTPAVHDLSLTVDEHEIVTLLGPSGCGKTTTLRIVAGFEAPDRGRVVLQGRDVTDLRPQLRGFGMVFQHYALFPHLDVGNNVGFGLEGSDLSPSEVQIRIAESLGRVRLPGTEGRRVGSLSGGQQQRVALARALAPEPRVLLLDEPLSNLDATLRERTRRELRTLVKAIGITTIYVTHDQEEAFDLSDRIAVMRDGRLDQVGPAEDLYHRPQTEFVARFLGRVGSVEAAVADAAADRVEVRLPGGATWTARPASPVPQAGARVRLLARPEALELAGTEGPGVVAGRVAARRFAGSFYSYRIEVEGGELELQTGEGAARPDEHVGVRPVEAPRGLHVFPMTAGRAAPSSGGPGDPTAGAGEGDDG
jgi:ABC-type Fe3+/spermidine/putrescine transport system ATPase subunit